MGRPLQGYRYAPVYLVLALVTLATFWPVLNHDFVRYDDDKYITENTHVKNGISLRSTYWAFTSPHFHNWHPLASLSQMLDCQLFGLKPFGHHLTSLLIHTLNVLLVFWVLKMLTGTVGRSAFVAAVFALHPLQVESVAWLAERKNVLSTFFWMLTLAAYVRYARHPSVRRYLLLFGVFCLGLMAKPAVVALPFVLFLLDFWPLDRLQLAGSSRVEDLSGSGPVQASCRQVSLWRLIGEKIPLLVPAAFVGAITYIIQQSGGLVSRFQTVAPGHRVANAIISYVTYIEKMIWPSRLAVFYPHPGGSFSMARLVISASILVLISGCIVYATRRRRYLAVGWLWYLGILVPVIGLVQVGAQARADRYMYVSMIGLLIIVAWGLNDLVAKWRYRSVVLALLAIAMVSGAAVCTRLQLRHWQNSVTLFEYTLSVTRNNYVMHNNYANLLRDAGRPDEAIRHYLRCLELRDDSAEAHNNLGNALAAKGQMDQAIVHYRRAIELSEKQKLKSHPPSGLAEAHYNLANVLRMKGQLQQALEHYSEALKLRPDNIDTFQGLGLTLAAMKRFDEAIAQYNKMLELQPHNVIGHGLLGMALAGKGRDDEAIEQFKIVLSRRPDDVEMYCNLGLLLERQDRADEAITQYRTALQINPEYDKAKRLLQAALVRQKEPKAQE